LLLLFALTFNSYIKRVTIIDKSLNKVSTSNIAFKTKGIKVNNSDIKCHGSALARAALFPIRLSWVRLASLKIFMHGVASYSCFLP